MNKLAIVVLLMLPLTACVGVGIGTGVGLSANLTQAPTATKHAQMRPTAQSAPLDRATASTKVAPPSKALSDEIAKIVDLTNQLRQQKGLPKLTYDANLTAYAQARAGELPSHFSHTRPNGQIYHSVLTRGYNGENIAAGSSSAQATVMGQWKNSQGHYANMVNPKFTKIGVGAVYAPNSKFGYYWVQVFGDDGTTAPFAF